MSWNGHELRGKRRYGVKGSTIRYRKGRWLSFLRPPSPIYLLLNFSEIGAHFISKEALPAGQPLSVSISGPAGTGSAMIGATVIWTRKSDQGDAYHTGIVLGPRSARSRRVLKLMLEGALLDSVDISTKSYLKEIERL